MERDAPYALVGAISLAILLMLFVFLVWLARAQFAAEYAVYDIDFKGPVRGLSQGGEVYFNGIKVGEVTKLSLDRAHPDRVLARIRTTADAPVKTDSVATLEPQGVTGVTYVQISAGAAASPLLRDVTPAGQIPVIKSRQGALESLLESGGDVLARSLTALDRVNALLSDRNMAAIDATLSNLKDATALAKAQGPLLADLDTTLKSVTATSARIDRLAGTANDLLDHDGRKTLADLDAAAVELKGAAVDARDLTAQVKGPATRFATTGLPQLTRTAAELQRAARALDGLVAEVERNPRGVISKSAPKTLKVAP